MSDSDDDLFHNNVLTFQNENTTICARGPNINNTNMTGFSCRNILTSTMHNMPVNFERQRYAGSNFDQRSMCYRRDTSPMSLSSMPNVRPRNFNQSTFQNLMGFQRPTFNGRSGSPKSVRSVDTTSSVSASDIVFALKNVKFDKHDLRLIMDAFYKFTKSKRRSRVEKRRRQRLVLKGVRQKFGEDSGDQGSNSSISSDDCKSIKSTNYTILERIPGLGHVRDVSHLNRKVPENQIIKDCTETIKQNTLQNIFPNTSSASCMSAKSVKNISVIEKPPHNPPVMTMKERFKQGFLLPSQRFKNDKSKILIDKNKENSQRPEKDVDPNLRHDEKDSDTEDDEIFRGFSQNDVQQGFKILKKRVLENGETSANKLRKLDSPQGLQISEVKNSNANDFIFAKPKMPMKKNNLKKDFCTEKLISKSRVPCILEENNSNKSSEKETVIDTQDTLPSTTDVSMRPSFIKRKLFSQKLDVAESKNLSSDSIAANSPQSVYSSSTKEKNKARKLVTSQSCLNREVLGEDNNVIDLIHKIVPPDQINVTHVANKTDLVNNTKTNNVDRWDITNYISNDNDLDVSDAYSDEEIFNVANDKTSTKPKNAAQNSNKHALKQTKIVIEKMNPQLLEKHFKNNNNNKLIKCKVAGKEPNKKSVTDCIRSFWDTDFESDIEHNVAPSWKTTMQKNQELQEKSINMQDKNTSNKKALISKGTILSVRNYHVENKQDTTLKSKQKENIKDASNNITVQENTEPILITNKLETPKKNKGHVVNNAKSEVNNKAHKKQESDLVTKKQQELGRRKIKNSTQCNDEIIIDKSKNNRREKITKKQDSSNTLSNNSQCSKDDKIIKTHEPKLLKKDTSKKVTQPTLHINNAKTQKAIVQNLRIQPKRKSKEKSLVKSPKPRKNISKPKAPNNNLNLNDFLFKDLLHNTRSTSRSISEMLSNNSSLCGDSSLDLSNMSRRSKRLYQRRLNNSRL